MANCQRICLSREPALRLLLFAKETPELLDSPDDGIGRFADLSCLIFLIDSLLLSRSSGSWDLRSRLIWSLPVRRGRRRASSGRPGGRLIDGNGLRWLASSS